MCPEQTVTHVSERSRFGLRHAPKTLKNAVFGHFTPRGFVGFCRNPPTTRGSSGGSWRTYLVRGRGRDGERETDGGEGEEPRARRV